MQKNILRFTSSVSAMIVGGILLLPFLTYADTAQNPIANPGLEVADPGNASVPEYWSQGFWGTNNAVFTYPVLGPNGTRAAKVEITSYESGDAKWYFDDIPVAPMERYVFSGHYLANVPADVVVRYTLQDGAYRYAYLGTSVISPEWTGYETFPFLIPEGAVSLTVFHLVREIGSLSIDNVSLIRLPAPTALTATVQEMPAPPPMSVAGGAVPLSYITGRQTPPAPAAALPPAPLPTPSAEKNLQIPALVAVLRTINETPSPLAYSAHAQEEPAKNASLKESSGSTLGTAITSLQNQNGELSDRTMLFLGLSLLLASFGIPLLVSYENNEIRREEQLWEP